MKIRIKDNKAFVSGECIVRKLNALQVQDYSPVSFSGMKGSLVRISWQQMDELAKEFGKVEYTK
jgi:hypothetical protein